MLIKVQEASPSLQLEDRVNYVIEISDTIIPPGLSADTIEAEGDLIVGLSAGNATHLPIGANGALLAIDTGVAGFIKWLAKGAQYAILTGDGAETEWSLYLLTGTTGGKTNLAITAGKTLTITATDSFNMTVPATGTVAMLDVANNFSVIQYLDAGMHVNYYQDDVDSIISSVGEAHMIMVDASANQLFLGGSTNGVRVDKGGDMVFIGSGSGLPRGEIYIDNGHTTQLLTTSYVKVTAFNDADHGVNGLSNLSTPDKVNSKLTITTAGVYQVHAVFSGNSTKVSTVYMTIFVDGVEQNNLECEVNTVENGQMHLSASGPVAIAANKDIDVRLKYAGIEATTVTCAHVNLNAFMIGA
jgi:hypothetical protein